MCNYCSSEPLNCHAMGMVLSQTVLLVQTDGLRIEKILMGGRWEIGSMNQFDIIIVIGESCLN